MKSPISESAEVVLRKRLYKKDMNGEVIEDWEGMCQRIARAIAEAEETEELRDKYTKEFYQLLYNLDFLPNSPAMANAGSELALSACFCLDVPDSMEGIFDTLKYAALIHKAGGGTGFSFSDLRPSGSTVKSTQGTASGPVSFAKIFNAATDVVKQGGRRRGANMGILRIDHPDYLEFLTCKEKEGELANFNISFAITNEFMEAVLNDSDHSYNIINPKTKEIVRKENALDVFSKLTLAAWNNGEPGCWFIDRCNEVNVTPHLGNFNECNPCGEQNLLNFESCNLASINVNNFYKEGSIDFTRLSSVTKTVTRFMDNIVTVNKYPIPQIREATLLTRKLGIGIMGLGDLLIRMNINYDSEEGRDVAAYLYQFIYEVAVNASEDLAKEKGIFPGYDSEFCTYLPRRNAALTSIAPTGTISMIADCSSGCEPIFGITFVKECIDNTKFVYVNKEFETVAKREGFWSEDLISKIDYNHGCRGIDQIPEKYQKLFAVANEISVEGHVLMQAALQNNGCDTAISKTINMPNSATVEDVRAAYILAWKSGCKGLTMYRDDSRKLQVLSHTNRGTELSDDYVPATKRVLPAELEATRFTLLDSNKDKIYVIVSYDEQKRPMEVFASFKDAARPENIEKFTYWNTVCRLLSLALRHGVGIDEVVKQLDKASTYMLDLPAQLSKIIKTYLSKAEIEFDTNNCPDCAEKLSFEEGCLKCRTCGYSRCS